MSKLFSSSDYVEDMVRKEFEKTSLDTCIKVNVISTSKGREIVKVSKASPETEFLTKHEGMVTVIVYEEALEKLSDKQQQLIIEGAVSCISYDNEKDKILIDKSEMNMLNRMRHKYDNDVLDTFETGVMVISQIEMEKKEAKEALKFEKQKK